MKKKHKYIIYYVNHGQLRSICIVGDSSEMMIACSQLISAGPLVSRVDCDD